MMALRFLFAFSAVVFFVAVANAALAEEAVDKLELSNTPDSDDAVEDRTVLTTAIRIIGAAFGWAAKHCLNDAALKCKQHSKNPKALVSCGKSYLHANKGRCIVGIVPKN